MGWRTDTILVRVRSSIGPDEAVSGKKVAAYNGSGTAPRKVQSTVFFFFVYISLFLEETILWPRSNIGIVWLIGLVDSAVLLTAHSQPPHFRDAEWPTVGKYNSLWMMQKMQKKLRGVAGICAKDYGEVDAGPCICLKLLKGFERVGGWTVLEDFGAGGCSS